jgi:hypothetical protein
MESNIGYYFFILSVKVMHYLRLSKAPVVHLSALEDSSDANGHAGRMKKIVNACSLLKKRFFPPILFSNCHLQLIPFMIRNELMIRNPRYTWIKELVRLPDGEGK